MGFVGERGSHTNVYVSCVTVPFLKYLFPLPFDFPRRRCSSGRFSLFVTCPDSPRSSPWKSIAT